MDSRVVPQIVMRQNLNTWWLNRSHVEKSYFFKILFIISYLLSYFMQLNYNQHNSWWINTAGTEKWSYSVEVTVISPKIVYNVIFDDIVCNVIFIFWPNASQYEEIFIELQSAAHGAAYRSYHIIVFALICVTCWLRFSKIWIEQHFKVWLEVIVIVCPWILVYALVC